MLSGQRICQKNLCKIECCHQGCQKAKATVSVRQLFLHQSGTRKTKLLFTSTSPTATSLANNTTWRILRRPPKNNCYNKSVSSEYWYIKEDISAIRSRSANIQDLNQRGRVAKAMK